jgi:hypothetical protein
MTRLACASLAISLVAVASPTAVAVATPSDIAVIGPGEGGTGAWTGERMRGARERLKDILPGGRT